MIFLFSRCRYLAENVSYGIVVYEAFLTLFILANFFQATFQDPGKIPRGKAKTTAKGINVHLPRMKF